MLFKNGWRLLLTGLNNEVESMAVYTLIEKYKDKRSPIQYELRCDNQILLPSCDYMEGIEYMHKMIQPNDVFQEIYFHRQAPYIYTYDEVMKEKELEEKFDRGEL